MTNHEYPWTDIQLWIEPLLAAAYADTANPVRAGEWLDTLQLILALVSHAQIEEHNPGPWVERLATLPDCRKAVVLSGNASLCRCDVSLMDACVRLLMRGAEMSRDSTPVLELVMEKDTPALSLGFDGFGRIPASLEIGHGLRLPRNLVEQAWTRATGGGRIDADGGGLLLRLKGVRMIPPALQEADDWNQRIAALRSEQSPDPALWLSCLSDLAHSKPVMEPVSLDGLFRAAYSRHQPMLDEAGIRVETAIDPALPPIAVHRNVLGRSFSHLCMALPASLPNGGGASLALSYDSQRWTVVLSATLRGDGMRSVPEIYQAVFKWIFETLHDGQCEFGLQENHVTAICTLPDRIGRSVETWIPESRHLADASRKMIRLLKSGGPTPPESFILAGVLEQELERWLMPMLSSPLMVNLAHEIGNGVQKSPRTHNDRLEKVLAQIARRKPKKEICAPAYAGVLIAALADNARGRLALGMPDTAQDKLHQLAAAMSADPVDDLGALRAVALLRALANPS
ncbi:MAG: hypothetical protein AMXMBFR84_17880 [Candidatus Hydrogenedentota bacterium]